MISQSFEVFTFKIPQNNSNIRSKKTCIIEAEMQENMVFLEINFLF